MYVCRICLLVHAFVCGCLKQTQKLCLLAFMFFIFNLISNKVRLHVLLCHSKFCQNQMLFSATDRELVCKAHDLVISQRPFSVSDMFISVHDLFHGYPIDLRVFQT